ncbi:hypothetical protein Tco_1450530, partial [Tanacetum coccineum]
GKCVLVDDDGKPLKKVDYSGDQGSDDGVESIENKMGSYVASKPSRVGYGTKSLLEQWRETYVNDNYDPYDEIRMNVRKILTIFNLYAIIWILRYEVERRNILVDVLSHL